MRRRLILLSLAAALVGWTIVPASAPPAFATEEKKPEDTGGQYVDLAQVGLPVIIDGRLVNYVFAQVRLNLRPGANVVQLRTKEPYFRDALVRAAHRTPFTVPGEPNKLNEAALKQAMTVEAARIAGPNALASVQVIQQQARKNVPKG